ncbi:MAG: mycofactocin-associated electron transfer flavoprotein alpha subunit [Acidimicrobiales bacterium]
MTRVGDVVAIVVVRGGRVPPGAADATAEAGGSVMLAGTGVAAAVASLPNATDVWLAESSTSSRALLDAVTPALDGVRLVILPASADGRDLAAVLCHEMGWPLLAGSVSASFEPDSDVVRADLLREDGQVVVPAKTRGPAVVTLWPRPAGGAQAVSKAPATNLPARVHRPCRTTPDPDDQPRENHLGEEWQGSVDGILVEPDPATMDLSDARRILAGGAGLASRGGGDERAVLVFGLLSAVAAALGGTTGVTRVVSDAGWMTHERQIGTTGVTVNPELYLAFGISGASQHLGGIEAARHVVSVNTDPFCPMTRMADLGLVADAPAVLAELARRLGVTVPADLEVTL